MAAPGGETIQGGTLFKGGHYILEKGFDWGHYSREYIIQGRTLIKEIRYLCVAFSCKRIQRMIYF